ncbi:SAM-dependent methyltransferase [soil metagenome]
MTSEESTVRPEGASKPPAYFEAMYDEAQDPWGFESRPYEREKYAATLAMLPRSRYTAVFEIGCSVGVLTERLAARCDRLLAVDVVAAPLERAQFRCRHFDHVRFAMMRIPQEFPVERFDLVVLSEVGYYWSRDDLELAADLIVAHLNPQGQLLLAHWRPEVEGCPLTGDEVQKIVRERSAGRLEHRGGTLNASYRLDLFARLENGPLART